MQDTTYIYLYLYLFGLLLMLTGTIGMVCILMVKVDKLEKKFKEYEKDSN